MALSVETQRICTKKITKRERAEHPVEEELLLADACPDIARILHCTGETVIREAAVQNGKGTLTGDLTVLLWYADEQGNLCFFRHNLTFRHLSDAPADAAGWTVHPAGEYLTARAVSPRKIEVKGTVGLQIAFYRLQQTDLVTEASGDGVQTRLHTVTLTDQTAFGEKTLRLTDEIPVSTGSLHTVLRSTARVDNVGIKVMNQRVMVNGELQMSALYRNGEGTYDTLHAAIPFSQLTELAGVTETDDCRAAFQVVSLELRGRTGLDGECRQISVAADLNMTVCATRTLELSVVTDAYSTACGLNLRRSTDDLILRLPPVIQTEKLTHSLDVGREITRVVDVSCKTSVDRYETKDGRFAANGTVQYTAVLMDGDGAPFVYEKDFPFTLEYAVEADFAEPVLTPCECTYTLSSATGMEVSALLRVELLPEKKVDCSCVTEITANPDCRPNPPETPLTLYYAEAGELLFDIARRYGTTAAAIQAANGLEEETLSVPKALLIPLA